MTQALEHCLQEMARTGDIDVGLGEYPQLADRLRPLLEVAQTVGSAYGPVPEAPGGLAEGRQRFLAAAAEQRAQRSAIGPAVARPARRTTGRRIRLAFGLRFAAIVAALVFGLTVVGGGFALAAGDSLPGSTLYSVKTALEDARVALTSDPHSQVDLALQLVEERVGEMQALVAAGQSVPDGVALRMERHMEQALVRAAWVSDTEMAGVLRRIVRCARTQAQILDAERAQERLAHSPQDRIVLQYAAAACWQGVEAAAYGLREPQTFRYRFQHGLGIARPTDMPPLPTPTPGSDGGPHQEQRHGPEDGRNGTPVGVPVGPPTGTLTATAAAIQAGPGPQNTPEGPRATPGPHNLPIGSEARPGPHVTPQGPGSQPTWAPPVTPRGPAPTPASQAPGDAPGSTGESGPPPNAPGPSGGGQPPPDPPDNSGGGAPPGKPQATPRRK